VDKTFYINGYYTIFQFCFFYCEVMMYKLNNMNIVLYFQAENIKLTIENFQEAY